MRPLTRIPLGIGLAYPKQANLTTQTHLATEMLAILLHRCVYVGGSYSGCQLLVGFVVGVVIVVVVVVVVGVVIVVGVVVVVVVVVVVIMGRATVFRYYSSTWYGRISSQWQK